MSYAGLRASSLEASKCQRSLLDHTIPISDAHIDDFSYTFL